MPPAAEIQQVIGKAVIDSEYRKMVFKRRTRTKALKEVGGLDKNDLAILKGASGNTFWQFAKSVHTKMLKRPDLYPGLK